tara:strand:- start:454 stop:693 length:240 start_codon:yes stop_codon:yes gene_type:complete
MTPEIILSLVFLALVLLGCAYFAKLRRRNRVKRYVVGFSDFSTSTVEEEPQPPQDKTLIDLEHSDVRFEIDYEEEEDDP